MRAILGISQYLIRWDLSYMGRWKLDSYTPCTAEQNRWNKLPFENAEVPTKMI